MTTRRTIHDMTDKEMRDAIKAEWRKIDYLDTKGGVLDASVSVARRLAGPDPAMLVEALRKVASNEATVFPKQDAELLARIETARAALAEWDAKMQEMG
jgi:hypothetical protein